MDFNEYQAKAKETALYPNAGDNLYYPALGLGGEVGEILNKVKKVMRDTGGVLNDETRERIGKELGDVLWYISALATELGVELNHVAEHNIEKLASRKERGVLNGSGDDR